MLFRSADTWRPESEEDRLRAVAELAFAMQSGSGPWNGQIELEWTGVEGQGAHVPQLRDRIVDRHRRILTGGIRCEKATALMLQWGFKEVYHLQGGILNYLASVPPEESLWQGECFVFDDRVALQNGLELGHYQLCSQCGNPIPLGDSPDLRCPNCGGSRE